MKYIIPDLSKGQVDPSSQSKLSKDYKQKCSELENFYIAQDDTLRRRPPAVTPNLQGDSTEAPPLDSVLDIRRLEDRILVLREPTLKEVVERWGENIKQNVFMTKLLDNDLEAPGRITQLRLNKTEDGLVNMVWNLADLKAGASTSTLRFIVERAEHQADATANVWQIVTYTPDKRYIDTNAKTGVKYDYRVTAVNLEGVSRTVSTRNNPTTASGITGRIQVAPRPFGISARILGAGNLNIVFYQEAEVNTPKNFKIEAVDGLTGSGITTREVMEEDDQGNMVTVIIGEREEGDVISEIFSGNLTPSRATRIPLDNGNHIWQYHTSINIAEKTNLHGKNLKFRITELGQEGPISIGDSDNVLPTVSNRRALSGQPVPPIYATLIADSERPQLRLDFSTAGDYFDESNTKRSSRSTANLPDALKDSINNYAPPILYELYVKGDGVLSTEIENDPIRKPRADRGSTYPGVYIGQDSQLLDDNKPIRIRTVGTDKSSIAWDLEYSKDDIQALVSAGPYVRWDHTLAIYPNAVREEEDDVDWLVLDGYWAEWYTGTRVLAYRTNFEGKTGNRHLYFGGFDLRRNNILLGIHATTFFAPSHYSNAFTNSRLRYKGFIPDTTGDSFIIQNAWLIQGILGMTMQFGIRAIYSNGYKSEIEWGPITGCNFAATAGITTNPRIETPTLTTNADGSQTLSTEILSSVLPTGPIADQFQIGENIVSASVGDTGLPYSSISTDTGNSANKVTTTVNIPKEIVSKFGSGGYNLKTSALSTIVKNSASTRTQDKYTPTTKAVSITSLPIRSNQSDAITQTTVKNLRATALATSREGVYNITTSFAFDKTLPSSEIWVVVTKEEDIEGIPILNQTTQLVYYQPVVEANRHTSKRNTSTIVTNRTLTFDPTDTRPLSVFILTRANKTSLENPPIHKRKIAVEIEAEVEGIQNTNISNLTVTPKNANSFYLTWDPADILPMGGTSVEYVITRHNVEEGTEQQLAVQKHLWYTDSGLTPGVEYFYSVQQVVQRPEQDALLSEAIESVALSLDVPTTSTQKTPDELAEEENPSFFVNLKNKGVTVPQLNVSRLDGKSGYTTLFDDDYGFNVNLKNKIYALDSYDTEFNYKPEESYALALHEHDAGPVRRSTGELYQATARTSGLNSLGAATTDTAQRIGPSATILFSFQNSTGDAAISADSGIAIDNTTITLPSGTYRLLLTEQLQAINNVNLTMIRRVAVDGSTQAPIRQALGRMLPAQVKLVQQFTVAEGTTAQIQFEATNQTNAGADAFLQVQILETEAIAQDATDLVLKDILNNTSAATAFGLFKSTGEGVSKGSFRIQGQVTGAINYAQITNKDLGDLGIIDPLRVFIAPIGNFSTEALILDGGSEGETYTFSYKRIVDSIDIQGGSRQTSALQEVTTYITDQAFGATLPTGVTANTSTFTTSFADRTLDIKIPANEQRYVTFYTTPGTETSPYYAFDINVTTKTTGANSRIKTRLHDLNLTEVPRTDVPVLGVYRDYLSGGDQKTAVLRYQSPFPEHQVTENDIKTTWLNFFSHIPEKFITSENVTSEVVSPNFSPLERSLQLNFAGLTYIWDKNRGLTNIHSNSLLPSIKDIKSTTGQHDMQSFAASEEIHTLYDLPIMAIQYKPKTGARVLGSDSSNKDSDFTDLGAGVNFSGTEASRIYKYKPALLDAIDTQHTSLSRVGITVYTNIADFLTSNPHYAPALSRCTPCITALSGAVYSADTADGVEIKELESNTTVNLLPDFKITSNIQDYNSIGNYISSYLDNNVTHNVFNAPNMSGALLQGPDVTEVDNPIGPGKVLGTVDYAGYMQNIARTRREVLDSENKGTGVFSQGEFPDGNGLAYGAPGVLLYVQTGNIRKFRDDGSKVPLLNQSGHFVTGSATQGVTTEAVYLTYDYSDPRVQEYFRNKDLIHFQHSAGNRYQFAALGKESNDTLRQQVVEPYWKSILRQARFRQGVAVSTRLQHQLPVGFPPEIEQYSTSYLKHRDFKLSDVLLNESTYSTTLNDDDATGSPPTANTGGFISRLPSTDIPLRNAYSTVPRIYRLLTETPLNVGARAGLAEDNTLHLSQIRQPREVPYFSNPIGEYFDRYALSRTPTVLARSEVTLQESQATIDEPISFTFTNINGSPENVTGSVIKDKNTAFVATEQSVYELSGLLDLNTGPLVRRISNIGINTDMFQSSISLIGAKDSHIISLRYSNEAREYFNYILNYETRDIKGQVTQLVSMFENHRVLIGLIRDGEQRTPRLMVLALDTNAALKGVSFWTLPKPIESIRVTNPDVLSVIFEDGSFADMDFRTTAETSYLDNISFQGQSQQTRYRSVVSTVPLLDLAQREELSPASKISIRRAVIGVDGFLKFDFKIKNADVMDATRVIQVADTVSQTIRETENNDVTKVKQFSGLYTVQNPPVNGGATPSISIEKDDDQQLNISSILLDVK